MEAALQTAHHGQQEAGTGGLCTDDVIRKTDGFSVKNRLLYRFGLNAECFFGVIGRVGVCA